MSNEYILPFTAEEIDKAISDVHKLGKETSTTRKTFKECTSFFIDSPRYDSYGDCYELFDDASRAGVCPLTVGESYDVYLMSLNKDPIYYKASCIGYDYDGFLVHILLCNLEHTGESIWDFEDYNVINLNLPAFCIICDPSEYEGRGEGYSLYGYITENPLGYLIKVGTTETSTRYGTLPENTIQSGNLIEVKDGVVRSTIGDCKTITEIEKTIINISGLYVEDSQKTYGNPIYLAECWGAKLPNQYYKARAELLLADASEPIIYEDVAAYYDDKYERYAVIANNTLNGNSYGDTVISNVYGNGFAKVNESIPAFMIIWVYEDGEWESELVLSEDCSDASLKVTQRIIQPEYVKIPTTALDLDEKEVSGSSNKVPSSLAIRNLLGELYQALENSFEYMLETDEEPTEYSENLISSGAVYKAVPLTKGFNNNGVSVNRVMPTGDYAWIEGTPIPYSIEQHILYYMNKSLSVEITTSSDNITTTTVKVQLSTQDERDIDHVENVLQYSKYIKFCFPTINWSVRYYMEVYEVERSTGLLTLKVRFVDGQNTFDISQEVTDRRIDELTLFPTYGEGSHTEGIGTLAYGKGQHVQGKGNIIDFDNEFAHIVGGGGTGDFERANIHTVDWTGNSWYKGKVTANSLYLPILNQYNPNRWQQVYGYLYTDSIYDVEKTQWDLSSNFGFALNKAHKVHINALEYVRGYFKQAKSASYDVYYIGNLSLMDPSALNTGEDVLLVQSRSETLYALNNPSESIQVTRELYLKNSMSVEMGGGSGRSLVIKIDEYTPLDSDFVDLGNYIEKLETRIEQLEYALDIRNN